MNQDVISFGPLAGQVGCVTGYLVTAIFVTLLFFPKKKFIGKKNPTLVCWTNKYASDFIIKVDLESRLCTINPETFYCLGVREKCLLPLMLYVKQFKKHAVTSTPALLE